MITLFNSGYCILCSVVMACVRFGNCHRFFSTCFVYQGSNRYARITSKMGTKRFHPSRGGQAVGLNVGGKFKIYKEMIPELVVPDLKDFALMPYVSLRCPDNTEEPVTAKEIFDACLAPQITENFKSGPKDKSRVETTDAEER
ncbi:large ribosomal subunit protein mL41-like [Apostichopus japonicus]|uniref:large ribosomal subunit protein mL41-like n=1 Tax=Stichopus japonicus TaxID=307972 RepID=UPI003AB21E94